MGVGTGLNMYDVVKKLTFAISSPDEFLLLNWRCGRYIFAVSAGRTQLQIADPTEYNNIVIFNNGCMLLMCLDYTFEKKNMQTQQII